MGGLPGNQLAKVEEIPHTGQDLARLVRVQAFAIEGVKDLLDQSVGDFSRVVRFREGITGERLR